MGGVDKQDQFLSYYGFSRRTVKWWNKVFFPASPELLGTPSPLQPAARLTERHFLEKVPSRANGKQSQHVCAVCSFKKGRKRRTTVYQCSKCGIGCCVVPCFELFHTKTDPLRYLPKYR